MIAAQTAQVILSLIALVIIAVAWAAGDRGADQ